MEGEGEEICSQSSWPYLVSPNFGVSHSAMERQSADEVAFKSCLDKYISVTAPVSKICYPAGVNSPFKYEVLNIRIYKIDLILQIQREMQKTL